MNIGMEYPVLILTAIVTIFWLAITAMSLLAHKRIHWVSSPLDPVHRSEKISVIIPARDEEEDPDSPHALASGALMLVRARAFHDIGGFQQIKGEMLDDVALARILKKQGYRVAYRIAPECLRVRLFKNSYDAFWGTTKNILVAVEGQPWLAIPLIIAGILQNWTPLFAAALGVLNLNGLLLFAGVTAYGIQYFSFFTVRRLASFHPLKLLFFPLSAIVATCCISRALYYYVKGSIFWRGREIRVKG